MRAETYDLTRSLAKARCDGIGLGATRYASVTEVVSRLLAVQAQEPEFSRWSVAQRLGSAHDAAVVAALDSGEIVRTHVLRPTWHYVMGEDLRWLQALCGPSVRRLSAGWYRNYGVDDEFLGVTRDQLVSSLQGGRAKTRNELRGELSAAGFDVSGQRLTAALIDAELRALICSGPLAGKHHTYALVEERLSPAPAVDEEEAVAKLVRRYLAGHAPASLKDLRWWSTLTLKRLRAAVESLGDEVAGEVVDGVEYLYLTETGAASRARAPASLRAEPDGPPRFELLQVFDELFVGYSETRGLIDPDGEYGSVLPIGFSKMMHVVLEDDRLVGRWRRDKRSAKDGGGQVLGIQLTRPMSEAELAELERAASRYGDFVGLETSVELLS